MVLARCASCYPAVPTFPSSNPPAMQPDQFYAGYTSVSKPILRGSGRNILTSQISSLPLLSRSSPPPTLTMWFTWQMTFSYTTITECSEMGQLSKLGHLESFLEDLGTSTEKRLSFCPGTSPGEGGLGALAAISLAVWTRSMCRSRESSQQTDLRVGETSVHKDVLGSLYMSAPPGC